MANANIRVTRVKLPIVNGTFDITIAGFGTPKAAIFEVIGAEVDNVARNSARITYGFTDGINQVNNSTHDQDNATVTNSGRKTTTNAVFNVAVSSTSINTVGTFNSWITDGVRLNITGTTNVEWYCVVTLIGGAGVLNATAGSQQLNGSFTPVNVGYEPTIVFASSAGLSNTQMATNNLMSLGVALNGSYNGDTTKKYNEMFFSAHGTGTSNTGVYLSDTSVVGQFYQASVNWEASPTFTATGWSWTGTQGNDLLTYLAIEFDGTQDIALNTFTIPNVSGDVIWGGTNFTPEYSLLVGTNAVSLNSAQSTYSICNVTGDTFNQYGQGLISSSGQSTTNCESISSINKFVQQSITVGSNFSEGDFVSYEPTGIKFNFTTPASSARLGYGLFIANATASGATVTGAFNLSTLAVSGSITATQPENKLQTLAGGSLDIAFTLPEQFSYLQNDNSTIKGAAIHNDSAQPIVELEAVNWLYSSDGVLLFSSDKQLLKGA